MAIIYSYPIVDPSANDLVLGSDVDSPGKATKNFTVQSIIDLVTVSGNDLQAVLDNGNTATNKDINITNNAFRGASFISVGGITLNGTTGSGFTSITSTDFTGTLQTAAQPNITSLGTLTSLKVGNNTPAITSLVTSFTAPGDDVKLATTKAIVDYVGTNPPGAESLAATLLVGNTTGGTDIAVSAGDDVTFTDTSKIIMGASGDFEIYHGSFGGSDQSWIRDLGTNDLILDTNGTQIALISDGIVNNGKMGLFKKDGAVELYYDNNLKFETLTGGAKVTGAFQATGSGTFVNIFNTGYYSDSSGDVGSAGQILSSTGSGTNWITDPNPTPYTWIIEADSGAGSPYTVQTGDTIDFVGVGNVDTAWDNSSKELRISLGGTSISGTGADTQVVYWTGAQTVSGDAGMVYNDTSNNLTVSGTVQAGTLSDGTFSGASGTYTGGVSITSTTFVGALTGNADTASALSSGGTIQLLEGSGATQGVGSNAVTYTNGGNVQLETSLASTVVTAKVLTNLPSPTSSAITASDTILAAMAKLQGQITGIPQGLVYKGTWNANTNTPTLASGTGTTGEFYIVSVAGSTNLDGITDWQVGDWAIFVEVGATDTWQKIDNSQSITGSGATNKIARWTAPTVLGTGLIEDDGTTVTIGTNGNLTVQGDTILGDNAAADTVTLNGPTTFESTGIFKVGIGLGAGPDYGSAGQVLTSGGGSGAANTWTTPTTGTVTSVATNNGLTGGTITTTGTLGILTVGTSNAIEFLSAATPASGDLVWFSDINDSNTLRKCTVADLQGPIGGPFLPLAGGTMAGAINMGTNNITNGGTATFTTFSGDLNGTINTATTAVTQSQGNNSTKVATTAYVDAAIGNSTLAEVLANGNTTGGTDIAVSANDDITFTDTSKAYFGTGNDLQVYHDSNNSYIKHSGTGDLRIWGDNVNIGTELGNKIFFGNNGAAELYYTGGVKKLETTSGGISVTGEVDASGVYKKNGEEVISQNSTELRLANDTYWQTVKLYTNGTARLTLTNTQSTIDGTINLSDYGSGSKTGTETYNLAVDTNGNVIETPSSGGGGGGGTGKGGHYSKVYTTGNAGAAGVAFTIDRATTGSMVFDVMLTSDTSTACAVAKKYTVVCTYGATAPIYNKILDTGPDGSNDFTVAFADDTSNTKIKCTITPTGIGTQKIGISIWLGYGENNATVVMN